MEMQVNLNVQFGIFIHNNSFLEILCLKMELESERKLKEMERRRTLKSMLMYAPSLTPRAQDVFWPVTPGACQEVEVAGFASHGPGERECGV